MDLVSSSGQCLGAEIIRYIGWKVIRARHPLEADHERSHSLTASRDLETPLRIGTQSRLENCRTFHYVTSTFC